MRANRTSTVDARLYLRKRSGMGHSLVLVLKSLHRTLWRFGIYGERLKHAVEPDGSHRLELVLQPGEVEDDLPEVVRRETVSTLTVPPPADEK